MATQNAQTPSTDTNAQKAGSKEAPKANPTKTQAQIDEAAKQTFPASDAPASWAGRDIAPQDRVEAAGSSPAREQNVEAAGSSPAREQDKDAQKKS